MQLTRDACGMCASSARSPASGNAGTAFLLSVATTLPSGMGMPRHHHSVRSAGSVPVARAITSSGSTVHSRVGVPRSPG